MREDIKAQMHGNYSVYIIIIEATSDRMTTTQEADVAAATIAVQERVTSTTDHRLVLAPKNNV